MRFVPYLLLLAVSVGRGAEEDAGWSKPVDGLRARLVVLPSLKGDSPFCRVCMELENVGDVAGQKKIRFDPHKLDLQVTDKSGKKLPHPNGPSVYDGFAPLWEPIGLPWAGTIKFHISFPGMGYFPGKDKVIIDVGSDKCWVIPQDGAKYYLSGRLAIAKEKLDRNKDWSGTLELPGVEIPVAK